jgi:hypothetical protein
MLGFAHIVMVSLYEPLGFGPVATAVLYIGQRVGQVQTISTPVRRGLFAKKRTNFYHIQICSNNWHSS